jgi:hypothetical protein
MMAPVDGSGTWPAWIQMVLNLAFSLSFKVPEAYYSVGAGLKIRPYTIWRP